MSAVRLTREQARVIAESRLFDEPIRNFLALVTENAPLIWRLSLARQRDRSRVVARRKQRSKW